MMFDFDGVNGTAASVPLAKINGLTRRSKVRGCALWVEGADKPFMVAEPYDVVRERLGYLMRHCEGNNV